LKTLTPALERFASLFAIDPYLLQAAAEASPDRKAPPKVNYDELVARLSRQECNEFLAHLASGEGGVAQALRTRLREFTPKAKDESTADRRMFDQLLERAEQLKQEEKRRKAEEARRRHIARMKYLAEHEAQIWLEVERLIQVYTAKAYDDATAQLVELKQLAEYQRTQAAFRVRLKELREKYRTRRALLERWDRQGF
jgi:hypothetical protein